MAAVPLAGFTLPEEGNQARSFSFKKPLALESFLRGTLKLKKSKSAQTTISPGDGRLNTWEKAYQGKYRMVKNLPEQEGCDYADLTKERYEKQAARQRALFLR